MQPERWHHTSAKWHFNMWCILGVWLSTESAELAMMQERGLLKGKETGKKTRKNKLCRVKTKEMKLSDVFYSVRCHFALKHSN